MHRSKMHLDSITSWARARSIVAGQPRDRQRITREEHVDLILRDRDEASILLVVAQEAV